MTEAIFRIIYCSRNTILHGSSQAELAQILAVSRRNNARVGVTGALLYNAGVFAQALEGPFEAVQDVFERIQADERHGDVVVLEAERAGQRVFGGWDMAHAEPRNLDDADQVLTEAIANADAGVSAKVLGLLDRVVRREDAWADAPP